MTRFLWIATGLYLLGLARVAAALWAASGLLHVERLILGWWARRRARLLTAVYAMTWLVHLCRYEIVQALSP